VSGIDEAVRRGIAGTAISDSRALTAFSFPTLARTRAGDPPEQLLDDFNAEDRKAIEAAWIAAMAHHVRIASGVAPPIFFARQNGQVLRGAG
jgi:hypothetical protein